MNIVSASFRHEFYFMVFTLCSLLPPSPWSWYLVRTRWSFPGKSAGKESTCNAGDPGSVLGLGRSPREGICYPLQYSWAFPGGSDGKEFSCNVGDLGSIPGLGKSPGGGHGNPVQHPCLENLHGQRSLWATVHGAQRVRHDWAIKHTLCFNLDCISTRIILFPLHPVVWIQPSGSQPQVWAFLAPLSQTWLAWTLFFFLSQFKAQKSFSASQLPLLELASTQGNSKFKFISLDSPILHFLSLVILTALLALQCL